MGNPDSEAPCRIPTSSWCGYTDAHCDCPSCASPHRRLPNWTQGAPLGSLRVPDPLGPAHWEAVLTAPKFCSQAMQCSMGIQLLCTLCRLLPRVRSSASMV